MVVNNITVEVAYAAPDKQYLKSLSVPSNSTIAAVIQLSDVLIAFPEIDLNKQKVGIFGKLKQLTDPVKAFDRIEIYRPLLIDPKEARKKRSRRL